MSHQVTGILYINGDCHGSHVLAIERIDALDQGAKIHGLPEHPPQSMVELIAPSFPDLPALDGDDQSYNCVWPNVTNGIASPAAAMRLEQAVLGAPTVEKEPYEVVWIGSSSPLVVSE